MGVFRDDAAAEAKAIELGFTNVTFDHNSNYVILEKINPYTHGVEWRSVLNLMPGADSTAISTASHIMPSWRGSGNGDRKHKATLEVAKAGGIKVLLCTVNNTNWPQLAILFKNKWKAISPISDQSTLWKKEL
jgi:GNAT superfamily N-acetyltransferase